MNKQNHRNYGKPNLRDFCSFSSTLIRTREGEDPRNHANDTTMKWLERRLCSSSSSSLKILKFKFKLFIYFIQNKLQADWAADWRVSFAHLPIEHKENYLTAKPASC